MVLHVSEHVLLLVCLCQQLLKMNFDSLKPNFPLNRCHVTLISLGSLPVFTTMSEGGRRLMTYYQGEGPTFEKLKGFIEAFAKTFV